MVACFRQYQKYANNLKLTYLEHRLSTEAQVSAPSAVHTNEALIKGPEQRANIAHPIRSPYTIGDPVLGNRFAGRDEIMQRLEHLWITNETLHSIVLYGHRRMGKTSILRNATDRIGSRSKVIYIDLQRLGNVEKGVGEVLLALSDEISEATGVTPPKDEEFLQLPQRTFEQYLKAVLRALEGPLTPNTGGTGEQPNSSLSQTSNNPDLESRSPDLGGWGAASPNAPSETSQSTGLIIALDEFETLETLIHQGQLSEQFLGYLRGLVQMNPRLAFAFAGLHTLEEMTADYFQPFFASVIPIRVGFLNRAATLQLLTTPSEDFPLDYHPEALEKIYALTHGQPYLCQLVGFQLVRRYNDYVFEQGRQRDNLLTIQDVDAVITQQFFQRGRYYFDGVWGQAGQGAPGQQAILQALATAPLTTAELQTQLALDPATLQTALATLQKHDVVEEIDDEGRWQITVALLKTWLTHYRDR
ncbi:MAG: ATP-binding protein [Cyanobacteria bacterium P01_A01_bin.135]